jgi:hypothetical protein
VPSCLIEPSRAAVGRVALSGGRHVPQEVRSEGRARRRLLSIGPRGLVLGLRALILVGNIIVWWAVEIRTLQTESGPDASPPQLSQKEHVIDC